MGACLRFLVPRDWTGDQALAAARLLRLALDAVWAVHGEAMAVALADRPESQWLDFMEGREEPSDDEIPF